jgi:hypothetical protein
MKSFSNFDRTNADKKNGGERVVGKDIWCHLSSLS